MAEVPESVMRALEDRLGSIRAVWVRDILLALPAADRLAFAAWAAWPNYVVVPNPGGNWEGGALPNGKLGIHIYYSDKDTAKRAVACLVEADDRR